MLAVAEKPQCRRVNLSADSRTFEPLHAFGCGEGLKRHIPRVGRNLAGQALKRPADANQPRAIFLQTAERTVVMALAASEARAEGVNREQRNQDQVRLNDRRAQLRLHHAEGSGLQGVAGAELEGLGRVIECRKRDNRANGTRFLGRDQR